MVDLEHLKKELEKANSIKKFYYEAWSESVKRQKEIEALLIDGSLDVTNPPLFDKIMDLINEDYEYGLISEN